MVGQHPHLIAPSSTGNGELHNWILSESRRLLIDGYSEDDAQQLLLNAANGKGRPEHILRREIYDAVSGAAKWLAEHPNFDFVSGTKQESIPGWLAADLRIDSGRLYPRDRRMKYLPLDRRKQQEVLYRYGRFTLEDFTGDSRNEVEKFSYWDLFANIDFPICSAREVNMPITELLSKWLKGGDRGRLFAQQFMVPNAMLEVGMGGKFKCDDNTGRRMYLVVEFDFKDESIPLMERLNMQARLLYYLRGRRPLAMVVYSGSKSLHGWFICYQSTERRNLTFFRNATELGADRAMWVPSQYCRMPWGMNRKTGKRQTVVYYDLKVIQEHNELIREDCCEIEG